MARLLAPQLVLVPLAVWVCTHSKAATLVTLAVIVTVIVPLILALGGLGKGSEHEGG